MNENDVWEFWGSDPCRDHIVGGLRGGSAGRTAIITTASSQPLTHGGTGRRPASSARTRATYTAPALPVRWLPAKRWLGWHLVLGHVDPPPLVDRAVRHEGHAAGGR